MLLPDSTEEKRMLNLALWQQAVRRIESEWMGVVLPAAIFVISFVAAWLLYQHFAKQVREEQD